ncbi:MAG: OsmC family protein [Sporolactobacillus sp.]
MKAIEFSLTGCWHGSWAGCGHVQTKTLDMSLAVDPSMGGTGGGTNPDELLLSALASCYSITLGIRLDKEGIDYHHISIQSKGIVSKANGLHFERVIHYPTIHLNRQLNDHLREKLLSCIHKAERDCMIAKAVHGNLQLTIEPNFDVMTNDTPPETKA